MSQLKYCGCVNHVPGVLYVVTRFDDFCGLPVIAHDSWVIIDDGTSQRGMQIPLDRKSVTIGLMRPWFVVLMLFTLGGSASQINLRDLLESDGPFTLESRIWFGAASLITLALAGAIAWTYRWGQPTIERTVELAAQLQMDLLEVAQALPFATKPVRPVVGNSTRGEWKYELIVLNDETHGFDYVIDLFRQVFEMSETKAIALSLTIHQTGSATVFVGSLEEVNSKRDRILARGADPNLPGSTGPLRVEIRESRLR